MIEIDLKFKDNLANFLKRKYGPNWLNDSSVISSYGKEQLSRVYNIIYKEEKFLNNISFKISDIDLESAKIRALNEANEIFSTSAGINKFTGEQRTLDEIYKNCLDGHIAEQYLIQYHGFEDYPVKYHDLIKDGIITEVKTALDKNYLDSQYYYIKNSNYNKSKRMIAFLRIQDTYILYFDKEI